MLNLVAGLVNFNSLVPWFTRPIHYKSPSEKLCMLVSLLNFVLSLHDQLLGYPLCYTVKAKNFN